MKLLKFGIASVMVCGLLAACATTQAKTSEDEEGTGTNEEYVQIQMAKRIQDVEEMTQKQEDPDFLLTKEWISKMLEEFNQPPEARFDEAANDVGYVYYLRAKELQNSLPIEYLRKTRDQDIENLNALVVGIKSNQYVRTAEFGPNGEAVEELEHVNEWKPLSKSTVIDYEYIKQVLNDLDVAYNQNGEGKTFGVTHALDGDKVEEMESYIRYNTVDDDYEPIKDEDLEIMEFKEWVAKMNEEFQRSPETRFDEAANDVGYVYYLRAKELEKGMSKYFYTDEDRDLSNLFLLSAGIQHLQFVRTASIDENGKAKENLNYVKEWKPLDKDSIYCYESIQKILNDLDIAYNKGGEGKTFGVTYLLDGENVAEVEKIRAKYD